MAGAAPDTLEMAGDVLRSPEQEAAHPPPPQASGKVSKTRVVFSLVGKVKEKMRARDRETLVSFKQLGRLAPPTPLQISGPTLQEVVGKQRIKEEKESRSMLPPDATTTPRTEARMAVTQWLSTVETPDSLAPTVQGSESPALPRSHVGSTLTSSKLRAPIYCPPETVPARNLASGCQSRRGSVPSSVPSVKNDFPAVLEKELSARISLEVEAASTASIDLDVQQAKSLAVDEDPRERLSLLEKQNEVEMLSRRAAEEVLSVGDDNIGVTLENKEVVIVDEESRELPDKVILVDEASRELPEIEDDFMEPEEPEDENAIDDDFMAKVLDSQAEFAFTQEREARIAHEGIVAETVNTLGKRGREEGDLEEDEEPIGLRRKRSRRIESDDEDDHLGSNALASKEKQTNTQSMSEGYMEGGGV